MIRKELSEEIANIKQKGLYRSLKEIEPTENGCGTWDRRKILNFASNNYLGIANDLRLVEAAKTALDKYGVGTGASRLISGTSSYHTELEERIAAFKNQEAALVFPSGFMANLGVVTAVADTENDLVIADRLSHASLIDSCRASAAAFKVFPHNDYRKLDTILSKYADKRRKLIVTDGVFSMDGDLADLQEIGAVARRHNAWLLVDDAHGIGVLGKRGRGVSEFLDTEESVTIHTGNFSKACGVAGGFVAGSHELKEVLINKARSFIFTTGIPPVLCAAALAGLNIIEEENWRREWLYAVSATVRTSLKELGFDVPEGVTPIIPVIIGDEFKVMELSGFLMDEGFFVPGIRYPTVARGQARLRLSIQATHSDDDIQRLIAAFKKTTQKIGVES